MRLITISLLALAACGGCLDLSGGEDPPPIAPGIAVYIHPGVAEPDVVLLGAQTWAPLGFDAYQVEIGEVTGRRQCGRYWYGSSEVDCEISIEVMPDMPLEAPSWGRSYRDLRIMMIRTDLRGRRRALVASHEIGHLILDVGNEDHLPDGTGIMSGDGTGGHVRPSGADLDLAADSIGWPWRGGEF